MEKINLNKKNNKRFDPCFIIAEAGINHDGSIQKQRVC